MSNDRSPQVSVITAAYNAEKTIGECIESVQEQTIPEWEMLIVDDCSTDRTRAIVQEYCSNDARIKLLCSPRNQGSGACRNYAITNSSAPYIAVMDADDLSMPNRLETQLRFAAEYPNAVAIASQLEEFGTWGGPETSHWPTDRNEIARLQRRHRMPLPHPSCMFKKDAIQAVGGYDVKCRRAQDYALMLKLGIAEMHTLEDTLVSYRTNRPITLRYALDSGRYGLLARKRVLKKAGNDTPHTFPRSALIDLRSTLQWVRRMIREK